VRTLVLGGTISKGVYSGGSENTKSVRRHYINIILCISRNTNTAINVGYLKVYRLYAISKRWPRLCECIRRSGFIMSIVCNGCFIMLWCRTSVLNSVQLCIVAPILHPPPIPTVAACVLTDWCYSTLARFVQ